MQEKFNLNSFLAKAVKIGASDIHLKADEVPVIRKDGKIIKADLPKLTEEDIDLILNTIIPKAIRTKSNSAFDLDFNYEVPEVSRFRINLSRQIGSSAFAIRTIPYKVKTIEELGLPVTLENFAGINNGLILVTGQTGSGKSTTLASLIDFINKNYQKHIITIEDPIEFKFIGKKSIVSQRQVELDTPTFADGVKYALRQDPDVIFVGEIRDKETAEVALKAAETGHLVFATLHTNDAVQTIYRIINLFDPKDRDFIRLQIAQTLRGVVSQKLILKKGGEGRIPVCEIITTTPTVKDFILKNEIDKIYELLKQGANTEMLSMNMSFFKLIEKGLITKEEALEKSDNKNELLQMTKGIYHGTKN